MQSVDSAIAHRRRLNLPQEICSVSLRRLRLSRGSLTAGQKSAEGIVGHVVGKVSEALEQPTRLQILKGESPFPSIACIRRLAYPERAEATKHDMPGRKSLGCPAGKLAAVGAIWEASKLRGLNITKCLQPRKLTRGKVAFA